jgi:hypothetical protein
MRLNDRALNALTSLADCPGRVGMNYNAAILKFRKAAHPFGLKVQETVFSHLQHIIGDVRCEIRCIIDSENSEATR